MTSLSLCGVVCENGLFLIARRKPGGSQGGKWEFPGGKQEPGETPAEALIREFDEELAVRVAVGRLLFVGGFSNGPKTYRLEAWETSLVTREFRMAEHEELRWVPLADLRTFDLSDSDHQVAESLELPRAVEPLRGYR